MFPSIQNFINDALFISLLFLNSYKYQTLQTKDLVAPHDFCYFVPWKFQAPGKSFFLLQVGDQRYAEFSQRDGLHLPAM